MKKAISLILGILVCLLIAGAHAETEPWICPHCGRTGNKGAFCGKCGEKAPAPVSAGDMVTFGKYPQTAEGTDETPITWIVLDVQDDNVLLLSRYALDAKPYHEEMDDVSWATCSLRYWLNHSFLSLAFTVEEQESINETHIETFLPIDNGIDEIIVKDWVFLLHFSEALRYMGQDPEAFDDELIPMRVEPTKYAIANGALVSESYRTENGTPSGYWWVRTDSGYVDADAFTEDGSVDMFIVTDDTICIRPAIWVKLSAVT